MVVTFGKEYLKELYETGKTSNRKYRFQPEIIKAYAKCIYRLQEAKAIEDLYQFHSLNYEILKGDKKGLSSIRVNDKYRIEFSVSTVEEADEIVLTICNIIELSNHYK